jgi:hypothetical protein
MATAREALLSELLPALPKERRYVGLMIANVMAIAAREHRLGYDAAQGEAARLRNLLGVHQDPGAAAAGPGLPADLSALRAAARAAIRAGDFDAPPRAAALGAALLHTAADWVAISNPKALRGDADAARR